jgi:hypothetical protein
MKLTKAYIVELSTKTEIRIDQDELDKVATGINLGKMMIVRNGIINPSYFASIRLDNNRMEDWYRLCGYGDENGKKARDDGMRPLKNIFEGTELGKMMIAQKALPKKS